MHWVTTTQILDDLKRSNESQAWNRLHQHFYPVIVSFSRQFGLSSPDAEDIAQETILTFLKSFREGNYVREKGRLSRWIFGIAHNTLRHYIKKRAKERCIATNPSETSFWDTIENEQAVWQSWQTTWQRIVLEKCLVQTRQELDAKTFRAFELYGLLQEPVESVCRTLNMTANAVYIAKNRVLTRLQQLQQQYEE